MKNKKPDLRFPLVLSLTLGLAPFVPEPHILGKIRWIWGGAVGMQPMDYFDIILHGSPWVYLLIALIRHFKFKNSDKLQKHKKA